MIPDALLHSAAFRSCDIYTAQLQRGYNAQQHHQFSPEFEGKIRKLKRKAEHPLFYRSARRVASILLALLVCAGAWLALDVNARAAVFGWIKDVYESFFVYRHDGDADSSVAPKEYYLGWLPDGYTEFLTDSSGKTIAVIYANEAGQMLTFSYIHNPGYADWFISSIDVERKQVTIHGAPADLLLSSNPDISSAILWELPDDTAFYISAFLSEEELIKAAESVKEAKN